MPAKATLYNLKGDILFDFGTGPRNEAHYDPFGKSNCVYINYLPEFFWFLQFCAFVDLVI